ncbi:hypothetical protein ILUMI_26514 [Ignelater luminosus]|uniref:Uncharacterized protein n=1 Tax=Ignelater luminosus TaxID=2038154 RepID=A0A8K0C8B6_IGNLU|nr:hypothetical protein ILUMI_26514 [Ignelater luminosus]
MISHIQQELSPETLQELVLKELKNKCDKYSAEIRKFALTLQFYSDKAYNYVRKAFKNLPPHPSTLRKWYSVVDGNAGFTKEPFEAIKRTQDGKEVIWNLVLDEMSIRQLVEWNGKNYYGFVNLGTNCTKEKSDYPPQAGNAIVIIAVALNSNWKVPLGHFLIDSLNSKERANLL